MKLIPCLILGWLCLAEVVAEESPTNKTIGSINVNRILAHFKVEEEPPPSAKLSLKIDDDSLDEQTLAADQQQEVRAKLEAIDRQISEYRSRQVRKTQQGGRRLRKGLLSSIKKHAAQVAEEKDCAFVFDSSGATIQQSPAIFTLTQSSDTMIDLTDEIIQRIAGEFQADGGKKSPPKNADDSQS